jgi:hypothetical protein
LSRCRNPKRVARPREPHAGSGLPPAGGDVDELDKGRSILWGVGYGICGCRGKTRERRLGEGRAQAFVKYPGRRKPTGVSSGGCAKPTCLRRNLRSGSKPSNRSLSGRLAASAVGRTAGQTVGGCFRSETSGYLTGDKAPKGESHERCRCETKPGRDRRDKAVKRVTKP